MILFISLVTLFTTTINSLDVTVERRGYLGDIIQGGEKRNCFAWNGHWNTIDEKCYCQTGRTFYTDLNGALGCYNGTGINIGCSISIKDSSTIATFYQKDSSTPFYTLGSLSPSCKKTNQFQRWSVEGWRLAAFWIGKSNRGSLTISWLNLAGHYDSEVKGHLFKLSLSGCDGQQPEACILFKNIGTQIYTIPSISTVSPVTDPGTTKTSATVDKSTGSSSNNILAISLGLLCAVLIIVVVALFLLWLWKRGKSEHEERSFLNWIHSKGRKENGDNIYEDIGAKQLQAIKKRPPTGPCPRRPTQVDVHTGQYNRAFSKDESPATRFKNDQIQEDVYEAPVEESSYEMAVEEKPQNTQGVEGDFYDMPDDEPDNILPLNTSQDDIYEMPEEDEKPSSPTNFKPDFYDMPADEGLTINAKSKINPSQQNISNAAYEETDTISGSTQDDIYDQPADEDIRRVWSTPTTPVTPSASETPDLYDMPEEQLTSQDDFYDMPLEESLPPLPLPNARDTYQPPERLGGTEVYKALNSPVKSESQRYSALSNMSTDSKQPTNRNTLISTKTQAEERYSKTSTDQGYSTLKTNEPTADEYSALADPGNKPSYHSLSRTEGVKDDDVYSEPTENIEPITEPFYFQTDS